MLRSVMQGRNLRLFMTADAVGGVWQYALDLARGLVDHRIETTLAVLGPSPGPDQVAEASAIPGLTLLSTHLPLDWMAITPEEVTGAATGIAALARDAEADIVHLNSAALGAGVRFHVPVVVGCHSCVATWWEAVRAGPLPDDFLWRAKLVLQGYRAADALLAPTAAFAKATRRTYGLKRAPQVVHNGRRTSSKRQERPAFSSSFAFTAGRLWDDGKNIAALDRAAARLNFPVLAAGPLQGPNGTEVAFTHLRTLGRLHEPDIAQWLKSAPVFVSTARYEPFGLAVLEAAQAGCPLVLSDIPSFRELWDGAALFVPADDDAAIAGAIHRAIEDQRLRAALGAAARERAANYPVEAMTAGVARIYGSLLAAESELRSHEEVVA